MSNVSESELLILKEIAEVLNEGTEIDTMLQDVTKKLLHVTGLKMAWIFLVDHDMSFRLAAKENLPPALSKDNYAPMCTENCWCMNRYKRGTLNRASNIIQCKRIEDVLKAKSGDTKGLTHHASVPLLAGNERFGILNIGSPDKTHFELEELALLESVAFQIGTALKRITLSQKEQENALISERNRLARDLHDSVNQLLFSLNLTARAGRELTRDTRLIETFIYIQDLAQEALAEMKALIWQLKPSGLEHGMVSALKEYGRMLDLVIKIEVSGMVELPSKIEEAIWRIGQEALANIRKHSGQNEASLHLHVSNREVILTISDKGCGFEYIEKNDLPSIGLRSMRSRVNALNGRFQCSSSLGKGTTISVSIPI
ncbi:GAF domain-containing sensor histidine kinase [Terrilactibacillus laevilacticus]|uniref:histidine kinase n=1 Tax=Terrilactibacillus laevilacticus TaxID=1380157 RepID=A0ABW5PMA6_9BACI|nr:GAF domain-containing sensor histidine kinase [Terrilactibacillus laevilacticus]